MKRWLISATILLMAIAAWSRISKMDEPQKIVKGFFDATAALFRGVLK